MRLFAPLALATLMGCQCGSPPTVLIISPVDGATLRGPGPFLVSGQVTDPDELISEEHISWSSDREGVVGKGAATSISLADGPHRLTLETIDSSGQTAAAEISIFVTNATENFDGGTSLDGGESDAGLVDAGSSPDGGSATDAGIDTAPVVTISQPVNGATFDQGQRIDFLGTATDVPDGVLTGQALVWTSDVAGVIGSGPQVTLTNAALGTHHVVLTATDRTGHTGLASVTVTVVRPGTNHAPTATITSPASGAQQTLGTPFTLQGAGADAEDGALTGASLRWASNVSGPLGTGATLSVTLSQGVHTLTLTATDSQGATGTASVVVSVNQPNNQAPTATITQPTSLQTVFQGTAVSLAGTGVDPEDGALTGMALTWASSRDGQLGTGATLSVSTLTVGDHTITLTARDSGGNTSTASVVVRVLPNNQPPVVTITSPTTGMSVTAGTSVTLAATANDPEDGSLTGTSVRWSSSRDGAIGTGASVMTASLSVGVHTLTATATDSGGRSGSAAITLTVTMTMANVPPLARLTGPTSGLVGQTLTFDGSTSSDSDGTIVSSAFAFGDGAMASTAMASHAFSMEGTFVVTLTVTDNRGGTGTASLTVTITAPIRLPTIVSGMGADVGPACAISAVGSRLFLAWTSSVHPALWFGEVINGALQPEVVDGLGFNLGGVVEERHVALQVEANGTPHLAYVRDGQVFYATKSGATWLRERVDSASVPFQIYTFAAAAPALALNGSTASVLYQNWISGPGYHPVLAIRTGPNVWTRTTLSSTYMLGDFTFDGAARPVFPILESSSMRLGTVALPATSVTAVTLGSAPSTPTNARVRSVAAGNRVLTVSGDGLYETTLNPTFSASTTTRSSLETFSSTLHAVAIDSAGLPRVVLMHGSELEHVWATANPTFWSREGLGPVSSVLVGVTVDSANRTRVCFQRAGRLMLY